MIRGERNGVIGYYKRFQNKLSSLPERSTISPRTLQETIFINSEFEHRRVKETENSRGNLSPGTKILSTPSSVIIANLIVPPELPSLDIAKAKAISRRSDQLKFSFEKENG